MNPAFDDEPQSPPDGAPQGRGVRARALALLWHAVLWVALVAGAGHVPPPAFDGPPATVVSARSPDLAAILRAPAALAVAASDASLVRHWQTHKAERFAAPSAEGKSALAASIGLAAIAGGRHASVPAAHAPHALSPHRPFDAQAPPRRA